MTKTFLQIVTDSTENQVIAGALSLDRQVNAYLQGNPQVRQTGIHVTSMMVGSNSYLVTVLEYTTKNN